MREIGRDWKGRLEGQARRWVKKFVAQFAAQQQQQQFAAQQFAAQVWPLIMI
jgi:hypothetical protein